MKTAIFDPFCGASGNMVLGAILDCGLELSRLEEMLRRLNLQGWEIKAEEVLRGTLWGTLVTVTVPEETCHRHLNEITDIIHSSDLPSYVKEKSCNAFRKLAEAEAEAHGIPVDQVHFHETGAMDAILDIVGAFSGLYLLGVENVHSSSVSLGCGTVTCAHGVIPVPAPATLHLLRDVPVTFTGINSEITTPTGAAILTAAVDSWAPGEIRMYPVSTGMGAGSRDLERPNLLRLTICETEGDTLWMHDICIEIRTIVDDMDPRLWPGVCRRALESGALDCYGAMCVGKKGRPAMEMTVICKDDVKDKVMEYIFRNTTTLGLRTRTLERKVLKRDFRNVRTEFGDISVKRAFLGGDLIRSEPELEDCARVSRERGVPLQDVLAAARLQAASKRWIE